MAVMIPTDEELKRMAREWYRDLKDIYGIDFGDFDMPLPNGATMSVVIHDGKIRYLTVNMGAVRKKIKF